MLSLRHPYRTREIQPLPTRADGRTPRYGETFIVDTHVLTRVVDPAERLAAVSQVVEKVVCTGHHDDRVELWNRMHDRLGLNDMMPDTRSTYPGVTHPRYATPIRQPRLQDRRPCFAGVEKDAFGRSATTRTVAVWGMGPARNPIEFTSKREAPSTPGR